MKYKKGKCIKDDGSLSKHAFCHAKIQSKHVMCQRRALQADVSIHLFLVDMVNIEYKCGQESEITTKLMLTRVSKYFILFFTFKNDQVIKRWVNNEKGDEYLRIIMQWNYRNYLRYVNNLRKFVFVLIRMYQQVEQWG